MIDNGSKTWTLFTVRPDTAMTGWVVVGTTWNENGPTNKERIRGSYATEVEANEQAVTMQREYDRLRDILLKSAREVNGL